MFQILRGIAKDQFFTDLSPERHKLEAVLYVEKKRLVDSGVTVGDIRFKGSQLFVKNVVFGSVIYNIYNKRKLVN